MPSRQKPAVATGNAGFHSQLHAPDPVIRFAMQMHKGDDKDAFTPYLIDDAVGESFQTKPPCATGLCRPGCRKCLYLPQRFADLRRKFAAQSLSGGLVPFSRLADFLCRQPMEVYLHRRGFLFMGRKTSDAGIAFSPEASKASMRASASSAHTFSTSRLPGPLRLNNRSSTSLARVCGGNANATFSTCAKVMARHSILDAFASEHALCPRTCLIRISVT